MTKPAAAAVNHHQHLAGVVDAHDTGAVFVVNFLHNLDLCVVIARSQRAQLG